MKSRPVSDPAALRLAAEARLSAHPASAPANEADLRRLQHELEVHQIELELQNAELQAARTELEARLERYTDLYDLAPVACFNLSADGTIRLLNLTGARLLGRERAPLLGRRFGLFVAETDRRAFNDFLAAAFATATPQVAELELRIEGQPPRWVHLEGSLDTDQQECRLAAADITERRQAEMAQCEAAATQSSILNSLAAHIALVDPQGEILFVNEAWQHFAAANVLADGRFGLGQNYLTVCDSAIGECSEEARPAAAGIRSVLQGQAKEFSLEYPCHSPTEQRWFQLMATPLREGLQAGAVVMHVNITERKLAESKLLLADRVLKNVSQGVIITGPDQMIVTVNTAFTAITGYSEREILGRNCKFLQGADTDPVTVAAIRQALEDGNDFAGEILNYRKDGTPFWNELTITPVRDPQGVLTHFIGITRDITDRKRAQDELRHSSERFELVARGAVDGIWDWDVVTNADYFSGRWCELLGYTAAELLPHCQTWVDHLHPEDRPGTFAALQSHLEQRAPYDLEYRMRLKCGEYRWFRASGQAIWDADGKPLRMAGSITDITARREAEASLHASESRVRFLVSAANVGLWDWDLVTNALYFSPEWKAQLGYADHELPSRFEEWESRLHPEDRAATFAAVAEFQAGSRLTYDVEFRLRHRDGSWRWIFTQAEIARDASGRAVRMIGSHIDITARKVAEAALRASDQRFNDLVNSTDGIVWEADATTFAFVSVSQNAERVLGYPIADWLQPGFWSGHIHPADREQAVQFCAACTGRAEDHDFEYRFIAADGRVLWLRDIVRVISENGEPRWLRGLMIDITAQKEATEALRQSQAMLHALTESTSDAIFVKDLQGRYLMFNSAAGRFVGKTAAEVLGRDDSALFPPDQARQVMAGDRQIIASGRTQTYEEPELSTADGLTTFLSTKGPIRNALGEIVGLFGISRDVTTRKQAEQELARTTEMLERTGELGKIGGWSVHLPTMKLSWTRETFRIAEIEPPLEPPLAEGINLFAPEARPIIAAAVQAAIDTGTPYDLELPLITAKGNHRWVQTQGFAEMRDSKTIRIYGTFQDITAQKHAQLTLRASEERFRTLVEHSPYCIHEINLAGRLTSMNRAGLTMMGVADFCAIQDLPYLNAVGPRDRERIAGLLAAALAGNEAEFTFQAANGSEFQSSFVPITGENGIVQRLIGLTIDITAQTHAATALRTSEAKLRALVAAIPDLIFEQGRNGDYLAVHAVDSQLLLAPSESLVGHNITEFLPAPIATQALGGFGAALDTGETQVLNYGLSLSGTEKHFEARIARCTAESVLVIVRDVTTRKQAEDALRASEAKARAILAASPVPMALNDTAGHITFLNPAFTATFGYDQTDIPTLSDWWPKAYPDPAYRQWVAEAWQQELARSTQTETEFAPLELSIRCKDGTERYVMSAAARLAPASSDEHLVALHDITARKLADEEIRQLNAELEQRVAERTAQLETANKELEAFSYSVSHDLRAPLRAVNGFAGIVIEDFGPQLPAEAQRYLGLVRDGAKQMGLLIDDLLNLSRLSRQPLNKQAVDTTELVRATLAEMQPEQGPHSAKVIVGSLPPCEGDRALLKQVWINLLSNAFKYSRKREQPVVEIGCNEQDGETVYFVRDNGSGFDMRYAHKLFGVFQRLHRAEDYEGTGVGLAIVQRILHRHGGRVWADAAIDLGATFYFTLPRKDTP